MEHEKPPDKGAEKEPEFPNNPQRAATPGRRETTDRPARARLRISGYPDSTTPLSRTPLRQSEAVHKECMYCIRERKKRRLAKLS